MRGAPGVGDGGTGGDARHRESADETLEHRPLATMKVGRSRRVEDDPVRRIGCYDRSEALHDPKGEPLERLGIREGFSVLNEQARHHHLRPSDGHADAKARGEGRPVGRQHKPAVALTPD